MAVNQGFHPVFSLSSIIMNRSQHFSGLLKKTRGQVFPDPEPFAVPLVLIDTYGYITAELAVPNPEKDTLGLF